VNHPRGTAGGASGEIVLFDQQRAASGASALPRDGDSVDPAANYQDVKTLTVERRPRVHARF
jgi:hypothetical protein